MTGVFERRQPAVEEGQEVVGGGLDPRMADDEGAGLFAEVWFGDADYCSVGDVWVLGDAFSIRWVDVDSAADDHVLDPVGDVQEPVGVEVPDVAGPAEAVFQRVFSQGRLAQVAA
jgi:hypothetical protein